MEKTLYILILVIAGIFECTRKVNTNNPMIKASIGMIMLGCLGHIFGVPHHLNPFVELGLLCYFSISIVMGYLRKRRIEDKRERAGLH